MDRFWLVYVAAVLAVSLIASDPGRDATARAAHFGVHFAALWIALGIARLARRDHGAARWWRAGFAVVGLPIVFSAKCWLLPYVHPEPYEYTFAAFDRAVFGGDVARLADGVLRPWVVEGLQLIYGVFYLVPLVAALGALRRTGPAAFDRAVAILVGAFLVSYLGYVLVPTVGPKVALAFDRELDGLWLFGHVRGWIDGAEANQWDCFPSGHTMLTLVSLLLLWRWHRPLFWWLLAPCVLLVLSTVLLRYHWTADVLAGALLVWPTVWSIDRLLDRDGWPPAVAAAWN
ncbi:MAG: phosphatase PAP2 family protein [Planctomycetes bacterium]|nr:phosphatase PAP2 family protein [Planctomycetota bacterium]